MRGGKKLFWTLALAGLFVACSDGDDESEDLASAPFITFTVQNQSAYDLDLQVNYGWLEITNHSTWLLERQSASGGYCNATYEEVGVVPPPGGVVGSGETLPIAWKSNYILGLDDLPGSMGAESCLRLRRVPEGSYMAMVCARLLTISCASGPPTDADFRRTCLPTAFEVSDTNTVATPVVFTSEHFPSNGCS